ncbi:DNA-directed RNA polymerase III subunit RPC7-like [Pectinophora gossypiella]|uniref:DNA-directed RNA polymerase III subunit RPC7-like n=1 Tax=Pectinophora gossypiella TaxID=13191 RepID=UPI00214F3F1E|nr:DNA-directed RNA polymerase III subunit RPC7-like [Pectinophora gossypiella]
MAGRGRGRGSTLSLTHEQLQALGIARGDNAAPTLAPPPLFPKLETKPLPLNCDAATDYMLIVKEQFIEYLHESPAYVKAKTVTDGVERYSDKYKLLALNAKQDKILDCVWSNLPGELRPQASRVRTTTRKRKLDDPTEIAKRLQTLEKKESEDQTGEAVETNEEDEAVKKEEGNEEEEIEDEQEQEYEMDDGTDYANNYFDNGEDYDEEDDNLDDGPVY